MEFVFHLIVVLHFVGLALLLGAFLVQVKDPDRVPVYPAGTWDGALTQLLTGVIMVGLISSGAAGRGGEGRARQHEDRGQAL